MQREHSLLLREDQLTFRRLEIYEVYHAFRKILETDDEPSDVHAEGQINWRDWTSDKVVHEAHVSLSGHSFGGATVVSTSFKLRHCVDNIVIKLSLLANPPPDALPSLPVSHALLFDPWIEPLPSPGPNPYKSSPNPRQDPSPLNNGAISSDPSAIVSTGNSDDARATGSMRLLVINSEGFTLWGEHYARLQGIVRSWDPKFGRLITICESSAERLHFRS